MPTSGLIKRSRTSSRRSRIGAIATAVTVLVGAGIFASQAAGAAATTTGLFPDDLRPQTTVDRDRSAVELGIRFTPDKAGTVTAVQYYQGGGLTGTSKATIWATDGSVVTSTPFTLDKAIGWHTVRLSSPAGLQAGKSYVASYLAPTGGYPVTENHLTTTRSENGFTIRSGAGVYRYGVSNQIPSSTYRSSNYFVDVEFLAGMVTSSTSSSAASTPPTPRPSSSPPSTSTPSPTPTRPPSSSVTRPPSPSVQPPAPSSSAPTTTPPAPQTGGIIVQGRSFPSAATTGVPAGTTLTPYTGPCSITANNVVIDAKTINCDLRVLGQGIVITRSVINGHIYSDPDYFNGSFTLTDSEVRMPQSAGTGIGDVNFVATRVEVTGGSRSINCAADCTVQDSYLHGQYTDLRGIDHESGIRMGSNSKLLHNTITCDASPVPPDAGCSAAITGYGDFAIVQKNTIDNNLIDGGPFGSMGYCAYGGSTKGKPYSNGVNNIKYTNNIFMRGPNGKCGIWGPITSFDSNAPGNVWSNNVWNDGATVPPAN